MIRGTYYAQPYNLLRITELTFCIVCLGLAIYILLHVHKAQIVLKGILILVAASFVFITVVDVIVTSLLKPILWSTWIIIAVAGALGFFLCTGLLMFVHALTLTLHITSIIAYAITGAIFLLELFAIIAWLLDMGPFTTKKRSTAVADDEPALPEVTTTTSNYVSQIVFIDKANQFPDSNFQLSDKAIQCPCKTLLRKGKFTYTKESPGKKYPPPKVTSHGGTFHVSKDVAPILNSCSPTHSVNGFPRIPCAANNQKSDTEGGCIAPETLRSRTVATSARTVPKQTQELIRNTCAKMQDEKDVKEQQTCTAGLPETVRQFAPGHYYIYPCSHCGGSHQHILNPLPTLDENNCYNPEDEAKHRCFCYPCPYAKARISTNKISPGSGMAVEKHKLDTTRKCGQLASSKQGKHLDSSKLINQPTNRPLQCGPDTPSPLSEHSQETSFSNKSEDNYEKEDDESQKCESKQDFSCNSLQNYSYLKAGETSGCKKKERPVILCTDENTVLPGTADRSPPTTTVKAERYVMPSPYPQNPAVIDFVETKADVAYLVPTQCNQQEVVQPRYTTRRRRKDACSIM
ncbi:hypothetical protein ILUMI_05953 [Ignelater luminosus]|uniref:Uncharacterized protein n=1 Tax=Ignelater luminosus TaxID=2038154 RepID=A0A8K0D6C6_IGNLU|nr:hypothetical protein ILUMI_05953 [Ignelater luminosus]